MRTTYEINIYEESFRAFGIFHYDFNLCDWVLSEFSIEDGVVPAGFCVETGLHEALMNAIEDEINRSEYL